MRHTYLVSYDWRAYGQGGTGHIDVSMPKPLQATDIASVVAVIIPRVESAAGLSGVSVTILSIYKFEDPARLPEDALPNATERAGQRGLGE